MCISIKRLSYISSIQVMDEEFYQFPFDIRSEMLYKMIPSYIFNTQILYIIKHGQR